MSDSKFVFPGFEFEVREQRLSSAPGYICWLDFQKINDNYKILEANLRKAPKLSYSVLHPSNNKRNVDLAIALFHETTIAAFENYFPERSDASEFLKILLCWWKISNAKQRYTHNKLSNAIIAGEGKTSFYLKLADWIESWSTISDFCFSKQTANALILTLRSQAMLIEELLHEGDDFVLTQRLQSDKLENRFSQYRQMSGGNFLVGLREIQCSERILKCRSLLKAGIDFWIEEKDSHQE